MPVKTGRLKGRNGRPTSRADDTSEPVSLLRLVREAKLARLAMLVRADTSAGSGVVSDPAALAAPPPIPAAAAAAAVALRLCAEVWRFIHTCSVTSISVSASKNIGNSQSIQSSDHGNCVTEVVPASAHPPRRWPPRAT
jgi:hypothetical protein